MDGVVNEIPVPIDAPPVEAAYQFIVPAEAVAPRVTVPASHLEPGGCSCYCRSSIDCCDNCCPCSGGAAIGCCIDIISCSR